jgi:anti-sigma factor RsiW
MARGQTMNPNTPQNCERIEALLPAFVEGGLAADDAAVVRAHVGSCAACGEALAAFTALEATLVSRRDEVPPAASFIPDLSALRAPGAAASRGRVDAVSGPRRAYAHPRLVWALRGMVSVPGVAIILVIWSTLLLYHFRDAVGEALAFSSLERLQVLTARISATLLAVSGGDAWTLSAIYGAIALFVLGSTGIITLRYVRH